MSRLRLNESLNDTSGVYFDAAHCVDARQSEYQLIEVFETPDLGKLMRIDGANMVSERDEFFYHESLIHPAAITHPHPQSALIIGGGDGGSAEELLKHISIAHCQLCELDGAVIELAKVHLKSVHHNVFADARLQVVIADGLTFLQTTTECFDLIYLDLTDPSGPAEALYTKTVYANCQRALNVGGALTLHIGSPFSHPDRVKSAIANLGAVFQRVTPYFVHIPLYGATWGFAVASDVLDMTALDVKEINARLDVRSIQGRQFYNGETHHAMRAYPEYVKTLLA
ncbi:MAG: polyamine aminopropyltransferase [Pseudomonadota bacterium]